MARSVNKFGVPYHAYTLTLDDGRVKAFDVAWEECWGNVQIWNACYNYGVTNEDGAAYGYQNDGRDERYVGYGNDVDGNRKIVKVYDDDRRRYISPFAFLRRCERYTSYYSEG